MNIKEGKFYKTRSGHKVEALKKYKNGDSLFWHPDDDDCFIIYPNNRYHKNDNDIHYRDIVAEWPIPYTDSELNQLKSLWAERSDSTITRLLETIDCIKENRPR